MALPPSNHISECPLGLFLSSCQCLFFIFYFFLVLILFYFLYNFKYIKVYFHRPQEMGRNHRTISLPTKKSCIFW